MEWQDATIEPNAVLQSFKQWTALGQSSLLAAVSRTFSALAATWTQA